MALRSLAVCIALLVATGVVSGQGSASIVVRIMENVHSECKQPVTNLLMDCQDELKGAIDSVGLSFPPKESELGAINLEKFEEYAATNPSVGDKCCKASCKLAQQGCGCHQATFDALVQGLPGRGDFVAKVFQQVATSCAPRSIKFKPTLVNVKGSCTSGKPSFSC